MTATAPLLQRIALADLHESSHNPRTIFDPQEMKELADSMKASGQLTPLLVRPHPNGKGGFEIAAGACRRRVAEAAGLTHLDAIVRELDDATFVEFVNVENRQRNNLHALDEARGFADWMKTAGLKIPEIAARIGLSTKYVYNRLKLLQLIKPAQKLFLEGRFEAGHAILLARLSPDWQKRAIGEDEDRSNFSDYRIGGLFQSEHIDPEALGLKDENPRKAVSVREFAQWIDDHVRFIPEKEDLPNLFPDTVAALTVAKEEELKVVKITRDYRVADEAKDPKERTYGEASWQRADGQAEPSRFGRDKVAKTCEYSVMGIVVAGPGRGEAFKVCVNKDKCKTHWATEQRDKAARAKRSSSNGSGGTRSTQDDYESKQLAEQKARDAERARWKKAVPELAAALADKLANAPAGMESVLGKLVLKNCQGHPPAGGFTPKGKTADDVVRLAAFYVLASSFASEWRAADDAPRALKQFGIDAGAIVDQVAPREKPAKAEKPVKVKPAKKSKPKKKLAGDVARAQLKAKQKAKAAKK